MNIGYILTSYRWLGRYVKPYSPRFKTLQLSLEKARILVPVEAYLSFMLMASGIAFAASYPVTVLLTWVATRILHPAIFGIAFVLSFTVSILTFSILYGYPSISSSKDKKAIEESLPFTLSFMGILSSAGLPPKRIFAALARLEEEKQIGLGGEARKIFRDMELLGTDMITALKEASSRRLSILFSGVLEGMISTVYSGGDFTKYLEAESRSFMKLRQGIVKQFLDALVMISEIYMALMVAFPLILIVMLVVMGSISQVSLGGLDPGSIISVIIYVMVPMIGMTVILWLDSISPR